MTWMLCKQASKYSVSRYRPVFLKPAEPEPVGSTSLTVISDRPGLESVQQLVLFWTGQFGQPNWSVQYRTSQTNQLCSEVASAHPQLKKKAKKKNNDPPLQPPQKTLKQSYISKLHIFHIYWFGYILMYMNMYFFYKIFHILCIF